tara:strand:+ start:366 stop:764 length:399 start_codon:yes stop_codon:yes gene_type:complete
MKLYVQSSVNVGNIKPIQDTIEEYLTLEGIFILKNKKVLKYSLNQIEPDIILSKFVKDQDCYVSYDEYKYEGSQYYIPTDHIKIIINRELYKITDKLTYIVDKIDNKVERYFKSNYLTSDPNLKEFLSTLII